jgi:hexosaminidase
MYNVQHQVVPNFGNLKVTLECIRPDVEIRYTVDGTEPGRYSTLYRKPWVVKETQTIKCATFKGGKQMGKTLTIPIVKGLVTGKNLLRGNQVERRVLNGVRASSKSTDGEWAFWTTNDSIALTFDVGQRKKLHKVSLGCLNDYGLAIHKPEKVEVWFSDNDVFYWKVAEREYMLDEIFREGCFIEDLEFGIDDAARYVRLILKGTGKCPDSHVRPGMEAQVYIDEVQIE